MKLQSFEDYAKENGVTVTDALKPKSVEPVLEPMLKKQFLRFFSACGLIDDAATSAGINRAKVLDWHYEDEAFRDEFERIADTMEVLVRDALISRALSGKSDNAAMFILKALNPDKWDDKARTPDKQPNFVIQIRDVGGAKLVDTSDAPKALPVVLDGELVDAAKKA